jgi:hypothetical protein
VNRVLVILFVLCVAQGAWAQTGPAGPEPAPAIDAPQTNSLGPIRAAQRSARLGVAMTMVVPGWGQLYADSPFWGLVAFGVQMFYVGSIILEGQRVDRARAERDKFPSDSDEWEFRNSLVTEHRERRRDYAWWAAAGYFVIALDAYVSISLADFDDPGVPTPDMDKELSPGTAYGEGIALRLNFGF